MGSFKRWEGSRLALAGLAVAAVLFVAVNVFAGQALRGVQLDLTGDRLFTLSEGTKRTLAGIDEPIHLRLYYSRNLGEAAPQYATYHDRVRELLERYRDLAEGELVVEFIDPEPFSEAEDRAVAAGLQPVPVTASGENGYFGLTARNSTDGRAEIPFLNLDREPFLEYDLTKLIYTLDNPERPVLGVLSSLPLGDATAPPGPMGAPPPRWLVLDQLAEFFELQILEDVEAIPERVDVLMIVNPQGLSPGSLYAIDQFVLAGGRALVFVDPYTESAGGVDEPSPGSSAATENLLEAWGVRMTPDRVAADLDHARRVSTGGPTPVVSDYVAWLALTPDVLDTADPVLSNVQRVNVASAGILEPIDEEAATITPLMTTGLRSMAIDVAAVEGVPDPVALLRRFVPEDRPLVLAARLTGEAATAFPDGPPTDEAADDETGESQSESESESASNEAPHRAASDGPIQVIVVTDADMLYDRFWVSRADFFGRSLIQQLANNGDVVINAVENLSEGDALIGLRGRGSSNRPLTMIEDLRRDAELRYRMEEQRLTDELARLEAQFAEVQRGGDEGAGDELLMSDEEKAAIERFRVEMLAVRKELRAVQHALRRDIEGLEAAVRFVNIWLVPLMLGAVGMGVFAVRRRRRARSLRAAMATG